MILNYYQQRALQTAINRNGKNELFHLALGLAGETGEVMEKLKKAVRDNESVITEDMKQDLKKELGDVLWYLAVFADYLGIKLQDVADLNLEKLADRQKRNKLSGSGDNR